MGAIYKTTKKTKKKEAAWIVFTTTVNGFRAYSDTDDTFFTKNLDKATVFTSLDDAEETIDKLAEWNKDSNGSDFIVVDFSDFNN